MTAFTLPLTLIATILTPTASPSHPAAAAVQVAQEFGEPNAPPPSPVEERMEMRRGHVWVPGNYEWRRGRWAWRRGHFEREQPGRRWQPGRWEMQGRRYVWIPGTWIGEAPPPQAGPPGG